MTNRKDPPFVWGFGHRKRCADEHLKKRLRIWNSSNNIPHPPPVPLSEGDKGGGKIPSSLVDEGLDEGPFRINAIRIWVGAMHELPLQL
jgi:hypothetical protein